MNICISSDWMPLLGILNNELTGYSSDIIKHIKNDTNFEINYITSKSFFSSLKKFRNQECDILPTIIPTKERALYINFSSSYLQLPLVMATHINQVYINDFKTLKNKKIAIVKDYWYKTYIQTNYTNLELVEVQDIKEGLKLVKQGRVFGLVGTFLTLSYQIQDNFTGELKIAGKFEKSFNLSIAIEKNNHILTSIINKSLFDLSKHDEHRFLKKWLTIEKKDKSHLYTILVLVISILIILIILNINKKLKNEVIKRKKAEESLKGVIKGAQLIIFTYYPSSKVIHFNKRIEEVIGYSVIELSKENKFLELVHEDDLIKIENIFNCAKKTTKIFDLEFRVYDKNKEIKWLYIQGSFNKDEISNLCLISGMAIDRTPKVILEQEIEQQNKIMTQHSRLAAMGEMIENIAHQWRQPLSAISTVASSVKLMIELDKLDSVTLHKFMDDTMKSANYLSNTINDFRNYFSKEKEIEQVSSIELIDKSILFIQNRVKNKNIEIVLDLEEIEITTYQNELIQALINIVNNAADALENIDMPSKYIFISLYKKSNNVYICIKDNAGGINEQIINRVFEPYYTTKHKSQGTGIGLFMSQEIIIKHIKAKISVENSNYTYNKEEYKGALFTIILPN